MTKAKAKPRPVENANFYSGAFTPEELALVAASVCDPTLDDELWMQRVLNHRLFQFTGEAAGAEPIELATLVKVAEALARGTGRVARLLRDQRALSGGAAESIADAIATALNELAGELDREL